MCEEESGVCEGVCLSDTTRTFERRFGQGREVEEKVEGEEPEEEEEEDDDDDDVVDSGD